MPLAFFFCWLFSVTDNSAQAQAERKAFDAQFVRSQTGIGISGASDH
jgi:cation/acetate symporter